MLHILILNCVALLFDQCHMAGADLFSAVVELEKLIPAHAKVIDNLHYYIDKEEKRNAILKRHLDLYKREHDKALENGPDYIKNPINVFTLMKRLTVDLDLIKQNILTAKEYSRSVTLKGQDENYPGQEDLTGAVKALVRLQNTYNLNANQLAEGLVNGAVNSVPMITSDCFKVGYELFNTNDFKEALDWMLVAWNKHRANDLLSLFSKVNMMEYISYACYMIGDMKGALRWTKMLLLIEPQHSRALDNLPTYRPAFEKQMHLKKNERKELTCLARLKIEYEALCRGELEIPSKISKKLSCRYMTEHHPFLRLAPIKMEMKYIDPDVLLFYDVMNDDEIEQIKSMATPKFLRARVLGKKPGEEIISDYRLGKLAWFLDSDSEVIARISRRVSDMTGFSMEGAEALQVVNYGIGGHYEPHFDFSRKGDPLLCENGDTRIATVLFYMSDVTRGGATVFTELGLSVSPVKGAALFWLNLHPSGEGDLATRHAACPVLSGYKWVSTKWIHLRGQTFIKPCNLTYQKESTARLLLHSC